MYEHLTINPHGYSEPQAHLSRMIPKRVPLQVTNVYTIIRIINIYTLTPLCQTLRSRSRARFFPYLARVHAF